MKYKNKLVILFLILGALCLNIKAQKPKLIEFGWDYPDVLQLSRSLPDMQNTPFDGICFSIQRSIMEAFDTTVHKEVYFEYKKIKELQWGKYSENYIILRGYGPNGARWFDDKMWRIFTQNIKALSKAMYVGKIRGILFDPEYYNDNPLYNPWVYDKTKYPYCSLKEVQLKVKQRGRQFIQSLQSSQTEISFLSVWLTSLIAEDLKILPLKDTRHVLLMSFFEGILEAKLKTVKVIDGNEYAYWYTRPSQFLESTDKLKKKTSALMKSKKAKLEAGNLSIAQPVYYDGLMAKIPLFERSLDNIFKWNWLQENLKFAMASTDEIVWFYSESINWWQKNINDTLVQVLQDSKLMYNSSAIIKSKKAGITVNKGYWYKADPKRPMKMEAIAFTFKWDDSTKNLQITFNNKVPDKVMIYINNITPTILYPKGFLVNINLEKFNKGKMKLMAKYDDNLEASGLAFLE